jgi:hypothetical protein
MDRGMMGPTGRVIRVHSKFVQWRAIPDRSLKILESLELQGGGDQGRTSFLRILLLVLVVVRNRNMIKAITSSPI